MAFDKVLNLNLVIFMPQCYIYCSYIQILKKLSWTTANMGPRCSIFYASKRK